MTRPSPAPAGRPRPAPACALCCQAPPASPLGLCLACLSAAAAEHARLVPRIGVDTERRPSGVRYSDLCRRCGSYRHPATRCPA